MAPLPAIFTFISSWTIIIAKKHKEKIPPPKKKKKTSLECGCTFWRWCVWGRRYRYTVTRIDVIFRYPDRVPLTHFVHRAKKVFSMWAWIFCWLFCATGIFRRCNGKVFEHRVDTNLRPSDYEPGVLPLRHSSLVCKVQWQSVCFLLGFSGRFCSYRKPNFPAVSGS